MTSLAVPAMPDPPDGNAVGSRIRTGRRDGSSEEVHLIVVGHASGLGLAIGIMRHESTGFDDRKARVRYFERVQDKVGYRCGSGRRDAFSITAPSTSIAIE